MLDGVQAVPLAVEVVVERDHAHVGEVGPLDHPHRRLDRARQRVAVVVEPHDVPARRRPEALVVRPAGPLAPELADEADVGLGGQPVLGAVAAAAAHHDGLVRDGDVRPDAGDAAFEPFETGIGRDHDANHRR